MSMSIHWRAVTALGSLLLICCQGAYGVNNISIKGEVQMPPPCVVNPSGPVSVNFGNDVMVSMIDGNNYSQPVDYDVSCGPQHTYQMTLKLTGTGADFDTTALSAGKENLGIRLKVNGSTWALNTPLDFVHPILPVVTAVLVKKDGTTLLPGTFSANAVLQVALR